MRTKIGDSRSFFFTHKTDLTAVRPFQYLDAANEWGVVGEATRHWQRVPDWKRLTCDWRGISPSGKLHKRGTLLAVNVSWRFWVH